MTQEKNLVHRLIDELAEIIGFFKYKEIQKSKEGTGTTMSSTWMNGLILNHNSLATLERCYEFIAENKHHFAMVQIIEDFDKLVYALNSFDLSDMRQQESVQLRLYDVFKRIVAEYDRWEREEYMPMVESYKGSYIFKDEEFEAKENFTPAMFCYIEEAIKKDLFKSYVYRQGSSKLTSDTQYYIYPQIGISYSLEDWLNFVEKQDMSMAGDKAVVTLFYKQDYASEHYNYFIITIHHKDSIWLSTDQLVFNNPMNKTMARKPERDKERHYQNIALPYELVDEIPELRKKNTSLVRMDGGAIKRIDIKLNEWGSVVNEVKKRHQEEDKAGGFFPSHDNNDVYAAVVEHMLKDNNVSYSTTRKSGFNTEYKHEGIIKAVWQSDRNSNDNVLLIYNYPDILQKAFAEIHTMEKMYFIGLVARLFEEIGYEPPTDVITTGHKHLTQLLLTTPDKSFSYDDNVEIETKGHKEYMELRDTNRHRFSGFSKFIKMQFDEMVESLGLEDTESKSLVVSEYKQVIASPSYEREWLGIPAALDSNIKWSILNDKRIVLQNKIKKLITSERMKQDCDLLEGMLEENVDTAYKLAFGGVKFSEKSYTTFSDEPGKGDNISWAFVNEKSDNKSSVKARDAAHPRRWADSIPLLLEKSEKDMPYWKRTEYRPKCQLCIGTGDGVKLKDYKFTFKIRHYKQLMMMLGITDRMQLPLSYRNYRASSYIPYKGNHILNNSHPFSLIEDPMSKAFPNGFDVDVWMCGNCFMKLKERYKGMA